MGPNRRTMNSIPTQVNTVFCNLDGDAVDRLAPWGGEIRPWSHPGYFEFCTVQNSYIPESHLLKRDRIGPRKVASFVFVQRDSQRIPEVRTFWKPSIRARKAINTMEECFLILVFASFIFGNGKSFCCVNRCFFLRGRERRTDCAFGFCQMATVRLSVGRKKMMWCMWLC